MDFRQCFPAPQSPDGFSNGFRQGNSTGPRNRKLSTPWMQLYALESSVSSSSADGGANGVEDVEVTFPSCPWMGYIPP